MFDIREHIEYHLYVIDASKQEKTKTADSSICTECFKSLGTGSRMKIYTYLHSNGPDIVNNVVKVVGLRQPTVSYHLKDMEKKGLLNGKKSGKEVYYSINEYCKNYDDKCVLTTIKFPDQNSRSHAKD